SLTDQKDADAAVPSAAYHQVTLTNLDGSGFLHGDYATVYSETGNPAYSRSNSFLYTRHQDEFEQVMAYYWITEAQTYIHSLGFAGRAGAGGGAVRGRLGLDLVHERRAALSTPRRSQPPLPGRPQR